MVGRDGELALLEDAFARSVRERSCHLFTLLGSAGVGKSRLLWEALRDIGADAEVLSAACLPYGEGITFWPVREIVKQATGLDGGRRAGPGAREDRRRRSGETTRRSSSPSASQT